MLFAAGMPLTSMRRYGDAIDSAAFFYSSHPTFPSVPFVDEIV